MCGIAAIVSKTPVDRMVIESMTTVLNHRGPDAQGIFMSQNANLALGHTRLSIIDLSAEANQPFYSHDGRYVLVFNGEIYNFRELKDELQRNHGVTFKTQSDTEVIAEGFLVWGPSLAGKLEGMFAIIIADVKDQRLFLFRDRLGKKPLFYFQSDSLFVAASEIKSLLRHPIVKSQRKLNVSAVSFFLHLGYIPEPGTIYSQIHKFPAANTGTVGQDLKLTTACYWEIREKAEIQSNLRGNEPIKALKGLLGSAVRKRLISDVPLGAFLSGGTDSSLVVALAAEQVAQPLRTFSIGFQDAKFDESQYARDVAKFLKTSHTEYTLREQEALELLNQYTGHFDEPFADTSAIPTMLVSRLARKEVKVVLTGDGGDELFHGYGSYTWAQRLHNPLIHPLKGSIRRLLLASPNNRWRRAAKMFEEVEPGGIRSHIFSQEQYLFSQHELLKELLVGNDRFVPFCYEEDFLIDTELTEADKQALFDLQYYLKDDLLVKVDRSSMYYGLESRCPLLDHHVVEFALSLHHSYKNRNGVSKWILKEILREYLPHELVFRRKWGFSVPLSRWLRNDLRYLLDQFLSEELTNQIGLYRWAYVKKLKDEFFSGRDYLYNRLWVLVVLHKWWKENLA